MLLLDEPLGALDLKLRQEMQIELKHIQQTVGITFIYVTHDQEEALSMSDRLAVFNQGRIEQIGSPAEVYERPATAFVANFVGTSNVLGDGTAVRPEKLRIEEPGYAAQAGEETRRGTIEDVVYLGPITRYVVRLEDGAALGVLAQNLAQTSTEVRAAQGRPVEVVWNGAHAVAITTRTAATRRTDEEAHRRHRSGDCRPARHECRSDREAVAATKLGGVLKVVAWEGYTENQWVKPFEKQTGCTVQHQYAGSSDEMYNLMKKNAGYDLVSASGDASNRLIASGLVQPIDPSTIPNWKQLTPQLVKGPNHYVGGKNYGLPWQWGPNVLMWNTAKYKGATNSWSALYDPKNKGMITIPNNPIQIADAALYLSKTKPSLGIKDPVRADLGQLNAAVALLKQQRPLIKAYWGFATDEVKIFQTGGATLGAAWPLAVAQLKRAGMKVSQTLPKEGATGWSDVWMLAEHPKNLPCAQAWLKYAAGAKVQAEVAKFNTYTPANLQSCKALGATLCKSLHADGDTAYLNRIKFWKTPLSDCGNGKTDCEPYSAWVNAVDVDQGLIDGR